MKGYNPSAMPLVQAVRIVCEVHTADNDSTQGFTVCFGRPPAFVTVGEDCYWEAWRVLRKYAASEKTRPSATAVELFQRALEIQAAQATEMREPEGRRNEYIAIDIALMRELRGSVWGVSALDVDENAEGPPAWVTNPWEIASWLEAISSRRALLQDMRKAPEGLAGAGRSAAAQSERMAIRAIIGDDRPVVQIRQRDDPTRYLELQFETKAAANAAAEQLEGVLKDATRLVFEEDS
jgi:hypothetical protein